MCFVHAYFTQFFAVLEVIAMVVANGGISPCTSFNAFRTRLDNGIDFCDHHKAQFAGHFGVPRIVLYMFVGCSFVRISGGVWKALGACGIVRGYGIKILKFIGKGYLERCNIGHA